MYRPYMGSLCLLVVRLLSTWGGSISLTAHRPSWVCPLSYNTMLPLSTPEHTRHPGLGSALLAKPSRASLGPSSLPSFPVTVWSSGVWGSLVSSTFPPFPSPCSEGSLYQPQLKKQVNLLKGQYGHSHMTYTCRDTGLRTACLAYSSCQEPIAVHKFSTNLLSASTHMGGADELQFGGTPSGDISTSTLKHIRLG